MGHDQAFERASVRHLDDAEHLHAHGRDPNADHLAGFAAECALKAIAVAHLDAVTRSGGPPMVEGRELRHLPGAWTDLAAVVARRTGAPRLVSLLGAGNPFESWHVSDRYADGGTISGERVRGHLDAARAVLAALRTADLDGALP